MATQESVIKLKGALGDLSFYKTADGYLARRKGGVSADRIKNDPAFERTRENLAEFGRAGKAAKLLRTALRTQIVQAADKRMTSRLTQALMKVIQADATNLRGQRNVIDGEAELLNGFEFNENGKLRQSVLAGFTMSINRATGTLAVTIPAFIAGQMIMYPAGATHCKLETVAAEIDFEAGTYVVAAAESDAIVLGNQLQNELVLSQVVTAASTHPLFLGLGIKFYQQVNAQLYALKNGAHNGLAFVQVDGGV